MRQQSVIVTLGIIQIIILTLFGVYFYRLRQAALPPEVSVPRASVSAPEETEKSAQPVLQGGSVPKEDAVQPL